MICNSSSFSLVVRCSYMFTFSYTVNILIYNHIFVFTENKMSGNVMLNIVVPVLFSVVFVYALGKWFFKIMFIICVVDKTIKYFLFLKCRIFTWRHYVARCHKTYRASFVAIFSIKRNIRPLDIIIKVSNQSSPLSKYKNLCTQLLKKAIETV